MRRSKYTAELLAPLVKESRSLAEVMRKLDLPRTGGNHRMISALIRNANLDTSHFWGRRGSMLDLTHERLAALVMSSTSVAQVLAALGLPMDGRPHYDLRRRITSLDIDTSHFKGSGWSRGETSASNPIVARSGRARRVPDDEIFVANSRVIKGTQFARRLVELGWSYVCAWCGIFEWRAQSLVLHLDHINGINNDNRFENLRLLCPNCHSQTPTYCGRNR